MPNGFTFRFLIECCNHKQKGDYTNALQFYNQALSNGIQKDSQITSLLLEVCKTAICKSQNWRNAISIFATLHELSKLLTKSRNRVLLEIGVDVEFMNTLLKACLKRPSKVGIKSIELISDLTQTPRYLRSLSRWRTWE